MWLLSLLIVSLSIACVLALYSDDLYALAQAELRERAISNTNTSSSKASSSSNDNDHNNNKLEVAHLIRVPKASSSSLSIIARRLVGCSPPGPCCKYPGDPPGSCPAKGLFNCQTDGKLIGCTHHYPNYEYLQNNKVISISMMREPVSRAVSAFFYPGIHHNSKCKASQEQCFNEYTDNNMFVCVCVCLGLCLFVCVCVCVCAPRQCIKREVKKTHSH